MIKFKGENVQISDLAKRHNLPWSTVKNRHLNGYRDEKLIVEKIHETRFRGELTTLAKIAEDHGLPLSLIKGRHAIGLREGALVSPDHAGNGNERAATKLDAEKVREIKKMLVLTDLTQGEIAKIYGIDQSHVSDIKRRKRWAKVEIDLSEILTGAE